MRGSVKAMIGGAVVRGRIAGQRSLLAPPPHGRTAAAVSASPRTRGEARSGGRRSSLRERIAHEDAFDRLSVVQILGVKKAAAGALGGG